MSRGEAQKSGDRQICRLAVALVKTVPRPLLRWLPLICVPTRNLAGGLAPGG